MVVYVTQDYMCPTCGNYILIFALRLDYQLFIIYLLGEWS